MRRVIAAMMIFVAFAAANSAEASEHAYDPFEDAQRAEYARSMPYKKDTVVFKKKTTGVNLFSAENELYELGLTDIEQLTLSDNMFRLYSLDDEIVYKARTERDVWETVEALEAMDDIVYAEPDYLYYPQVSGAMTVSGDADQWYLDDAKISDAWDMTGSCGSADTVIAVIDTGVDYTHSDLSASMWVNENEIPGNGIDDDGNGYIDDVYGCSTVSDERFHSGDPMDDHGHGTHVAGIIGMQPDNGEGGTGAACGCRIMAVKAGQSTGVFSATDIAEAIDYAYSMGADVINMSFGSYAESNVVRDALEKAFSSCVLVASAGNDGMPNQPSPDGRDMYPAAYDWVIGVMAHDSNGALADFSNYEYKEHSGGEYELCAPGCEIYSTLPGNRYAKWSGTSMAAPMVSAAAALMRSEYSDKEAYSSRFIMSQLISASEETVTSAHGEFTKLDACGALTAPAKPEVCYKEFYLFDSSGISPENDGDGMADAGEVIELGIRLKNYWGAASDVSVSIDTLSEGGLENPYAEIENGSVEYGGIGIFNEADNGFISSDGVVTGVTEPFRIRISPDTPNDTVIRLNVTISAKNGSDAEDTQIYESTGEIVFSVQSGREIGGYITENMTLTKDYYWILNSSVMIPEGVRVDIEPGTQVQFYSDENNDVYIHSDGELNISGTEDEPVQLFTGAGFEDKTVKISGNAAISYAQIMNPYIEVSSIDHIDTYGGVSDVPMKLIADRVERSRIGTKVNYNWYLAIGTNEPDSYDCVLFDNITAEYSGITAYRNCAFLINRSDFSDDYASWKTSKFENKGFWIYNNRKQVYSDIRIENGKKTVACAFQRGYPAEDPSWSNDEITRALKKRYGDDWMNDVNAYIAEQKGGTLIKNDAIIRDWFGQEVMETEDLRGSAFVMEFDADVPDELITAQADLSGFFSGFTENNAFLNRLTCPDTEKWMKIVTTKSYDVTYYLKNNYWGTTSEKMIERQITDQEDSVKLAKIVYEPYQTEPSAEIYPFVSDISVYDQAGGKTDRIGMETMSVRVTFNRDMDMQRQPEVYFGPAEPYTDFIVRGDWISPRVWEGIYDVKPSVGDGLQYFRVSGAAAADDAWLVTGDDSARFMFEIVTTGAESMQLAAEAVENAVELEWIQDDYDTIAGYNIYRSDSSEGVYERINSSLIAPDTTAYTDTDVEPGMTYYYRFTVVLTDMAETVQSQTAQATVYDSIAPVIEHIPVTEAAAGAPLSISADVTDNISVEYVLLCYRTAGAEQWKTAVMQRIAEDKYSAAVPGSDTAAALEYYIEAYDGTGRAYSGSEEQPYTVTVNNTPVIFNITPAVCDLAGGAEFELTGVNFSDGAKVYIGDTEAQGAAVTGGTRITGVLPPNAEGYKDVRIVNGDGSEYILIKGIEYKNQSGSILLEVRGGSRDENIIVTARADTALALTSAEFNVSYSESLLEFVDVQKSTTAAGLELEYEKENGKIHIKMEGDEALSYPVLCRLSFRVRSGISSSFTYVSSKDVYINSNAAQGNDAFVNLDSSYTLRGNVSYYSDGAAVGGVNISLGSESAVTDGSGSYTSGLINEGVYKITASKTGDQRNITAYDAALTLKSAVGNAELSDAQRIAADVNGDGSVNSADAALILQMAAGKITGAFPGSGKEWSFLPESCEHELNENGVVNFEAIELGDTSGNWGETSAQGGVSDTLIYHAPSGSRRVTIPVALPDTLADGIIGIDARAEFDGGEILNATFSTSESGCKIEQSADSGVLRMAMIRGAEAELSSEPVLFLELELAKPLIEEIELEIDYVMLNEVSAVKDRKILIRTLEPELPETPPKKGELFEAELEYTSSDIDMEGAAMYAAGYDEDGRLLYLYMAENADGVFSISRNADESADCIKLFLWNNQSLIPLMQSIKKEDS